MILRMMLLGALMSSSLVMAADNRRAGDLFATAKASLEANIVELREGGVLRAGSHQFASLWTRDFCFASRGLWAIGREDVIASHLSRLLKNIRPEDGLVPRVLDSKPSWQRVARYSLVPFRPDSPDVKDDLKAEYKGEHGTVAIDSNALVLITAHEYVSRTGDQAWFEEHKAALKSVLDFYQSYFASALVVQEKYADWQDSVKREGATFFTNFLVWKALNSFKDDKFFEIDENVVTNFRKNIEEKFFDSKMGLYRSLDHGDWVSLEGILYALEDDNFLSESNRRSVYTSLTKHPLWMSVPGVPTYPKYPRNQISFTTKAVGLRSYHDGLVWPWLTAFSGKIAKRMGDESAARRIKHVLSQWAKRDGEINEVMDPKKKMRPVRRMFYRSEAPFSWGAGFVLDMLVEK